VNAASLCLPLVALLVTARACLHASRVASPNEF